MSFAATLLTIGFVAFLFLLDWDRRAKTSLALWMPVLWLGIAGSRPVSAWWAYSEENSAAQMLEGSPFDRNVYIALLAVGIVCLLPRMKRAMQVLRDNVALSVFLLYCMVSIAWSDFPDVAAKRWIKSLGDVVVILIIVTEADRAAALKRVFARVGFVLLPFSALLIRYYSDLGRTYSKWDGMVMYTGVTTDKNMLGMTCLMFGLGASWRVMQELTGPRRSKIMLAHGILFLLACYLLKTCDSMTSLACLLLGTSLMFSVSFVPFTRRPVVLNTFVISMVSVAFVVLFLPVGRDILEALGRDPTLTGRTVLWDDLILMNPNKLLGAGFESFWLGPRLEELWAKHWWQPNESHNGYLEVYLNLGWLGVGLLAALSIVGYKNMLRVLQANPSAGQLGLAFFVVGIVYNFTEAAIRTMDPVWIFYLMAGLTLRPGRSARAYEPAAAEPMTEDRWVAANG